MTLKFLSLKRFDPSTYGPVGKLKQKNAAVEPLLADFDLVPACLQTAQQYAKGLMGFEDPVLMLIITTLQKGNSRQAVAALRATCRRLRILVNQTCGTLQVPTDQVSLLGELHSPVRGLTSCCTVKLLHRYTASPFPAQSIVKLVEAIGVRLGDPSLGSSASAETPVSPGESSPALLTSSSSTSSLSSKGVVRSKSKKRFAGCNGCFFQQPVADDFQAVERAPSNSIPTFIFPEPTLFSQLTSLQLIYSSSGPPNLQQLLHSCSQLPKLQDFRLSRLPIVAHSPTHDLSTPVLTCNSLEMKAMVSSAPWDVLPSSLSSLHLDIPYWETALPMLSHLTLLTSLHGDRKAHFQDLEYWRSPLPASLPDSVEDLRGLHVTTYADLLKLAALTSLTRLEFQSLNWDWNDPIMGGPNSLNIALKMLTALKGLHWLSIKQDSKASVVEKNTLEWLMKLGKLERLELRGCKLFPEVLIPVVTQMTGLKSVMLDDCVDFHTGPGQNSWPELFQVSTLRELRLEVPGLHNTGPDFGGCALEKGIFQCFNPTRTSAISASLHTLHLGCMQSQDATWLLDPLTNLPKLKHLSLALQDVTFQVSSKLNILTQVTRFDLLLKLPESVASQPDIAGFVSCLADTSKFHWMSVPLAPVLLTTVTSVRETLRALQGLSKFHNIHEVSIPFKVDWPHERPLDPLHLKSFDHLIRALASLAHLKKLVIDVQGVLPVNMDIYEPLMQLGELQLLEQGRLVLREKQRMHVGSMFRLAVKRLAAIGVAMQLSEPTADFRLGRSRVMSEPQKVFCLVPSIIC